MKELFDKLWERFVNRETLTYIIFGVLTTAVDWLVYPLMRGLGLSVGFSSAVSWSAAVLFAFVTNKLYVFESFGFGIRELGREFISFLSCRAFTGVLTVVAMMVMVNGLGWNEWFGKFLVSAVSLVLNYVFSKLFIFKKEAAKEE